MKNDFTIGEITKCKEDEVKPCPFCGGKEIVIDNSFHLFILQSFHNNLFW